jgi:hypothetical protein
MKNPAIKRRIKKEREINKIKMEFFFAITTP